MIRVIMKKSGGKLRGIRISGHANAAAHGEDIVCAAVSVLGQTMLLGVADQLGREIPYEMGEGKLSFDLPEDLKGEESIRAEALMQTLCLGIENLQQSYRKYIKITKEEV